jgi:hypothetical protein
MPLLLLVRVIFADIEDHRGTLGVMEGRRSLFNVYFQLTVVFGVVG